MAFDIPTVKPSSEVFGDWLKLIVKHKYAQELANSPIGDVRNAAYVQSLLSKYGADDPRYLEAKRALDTNIDAQQNLMDYRKSLGATAPYRATSNFGKQLAERNGRGALDMQTPMSPADKFRQVAGLSGQTNTASSMTQEGQAGPEQGLNDDGSDGTQLIDNQSYAQSQPMPLAPQQQQPLDTRYTPQGNQASTKEMYDQHLLKQTSDPTARQRLIYATNIEKTLANINPDDLVRYSGAKGNLNKGLDIFRDSVMGNPSPEYQNHTNAVNSARLLAGQIRQFFGDSVQASARHELGNLTNPSAWNKSPETAKKNFQSLVNIFRSEGETYKDALARGLPYAASKIEFSDGRFKTVGDSNSADDNEADKFSKSLIGEFPEATPENLVATANEEGLTLQELADQLRATKKKAK